MLVKLIMIFMLKIIFLLVLLLMTFQLHLDYIVVSFDVVSLFADYSKDVVIQNLSNHWHIIPQHCTLNFDNLLLILKFIYDSNFLPSNNYYNKQIFGTPKTSNFLPY